jgi:hypothetical protein
VTDKERLLMEALEELVKYLWAVTSPGWDKTTKQIENNLEDKKERNEKTGSGDSARGSNDRVQETT